MNNEFEFLIAARKGKLERVKKILSEEAAHINISKDARNWAFVTSVANGRLLMATWLLEYGGAAFSSKGRSNIWDLLLEYTLWHKHDKTAVSSLLQVMVLKGVPPARFSLAASLSVENMQVVNEGTRIRTRLSAYLAQRRALVDEHSPLIAPLQALVCDYEAPTTTNELWATGLGADL
jgi:hypothetical protein